MATPLTPTRLIRSKGVGVFFVTQTPKDVPSDVLAQRGPPLLMSLKSCYFMVPCDTEPCSCRWKTM